MTPYLVFDGILKGNKVILQPFTENDITIDYISWLNNSEVVRYSNQRFKDHDYESCVRYIKSFINTDSFFIAIRRLDDNQLIGTMTAYVSRHHQTVDVGIMVGERNVWGEGFGQDAWNTLIEWLCAQHNIRKVTAGTLSCNDGMLKIIQRSGMEFEACRKGQELIDGVPCDILYFSRWHED